jgi:hypothetical protein
LHGEQTGPEKCRVCKENFDLLKEPTPCGPCDYKPPLKDAALSQFIFLWSHICTQWRAGGMGVVGLDYPAVKMVCDAIGIDFDMFLLRKIKIAESIELEKIRKQ